MATEDKVPFQIIGEVPQDKLNELVGYMGALGVQVKSGKELEIVSPSILIEYVEGANGLPIPAITEQTVEEYMVAEGGDEHGSKTNADQFHGTLMGHASHGHEFSEGLNYWRRPCEGCDCPLHPVIARKHLGSNFMPYMGDLFPSGIDPQSLIEFSKLPFDEARQKVTGLGAKRYAMVQKMAERLQADTDLGK